MSPFPRASYRLLSRYSPDRRPVEVDLSDNTSRWGAHPAALRAIRSAAPEDLTRYPDVYAEGLRSAVARRYGVPPECVTTGCGSDDLLDSAFRGAGEPGEAVAYIPPTFSMVEVFARANGMEPRPVDSSDPAALFEGNPAAVYLCRPNNPTGEVLPRAAVEALIEAATPDGPIVLLDEAYADFADDDLLREAPATARLVVVRTLSKAFALAGLRVGFAVGPPDVVFEIEKSRGPYKVNRLAEAAAVAVLEDEDGWAARVVAEVKEGRARLLEAMSARGLRPLPSQANFVLLPLSGAPPGTPGAEAPRTAVEVTAELRDRGVAVRPFPDLPGIGDAIRISVGPEPEMDRFLEALDEVLA